MSRELDEVLFTGIAETMHTIAEGSLIREGYVRSVLLLFDRYCREQTVAFVGYFENNEEGLRAEVRKHGAVAAILIRQGAGIDVPVGLAELPPEDWPLPSESPGLRTVLLSEARWPARGVYEMRKSQMRTVDDSGVPTLVRDIGDPAHGRATADVLARILPA